MPLRTIRPGRTMRSASIPSSSPLRRVRPMPWTARSPSASCRTNWWPMPHRARQRKSSARSPASVPNPQAATVTPTSPFAAFPSRRAVPSSCSCRKTDCRSCNSATLLSAMPTSFCAPTRPFHRSRPWFGVDPGVERAGRGHQLHLQGRARGRRRRHRDDWRRLRGLPARLRLRRPSGREHPVQRRRFLAGRRRAARCRLQRQQRLSDQGKPDAGIRQRLCTALRQASG